MCVSPWIISFLLPEAAQIQRRIWLLPVSIATEEREGMLREHFIWSADRLHLIGLSPIGRATIEALELNRVRAIRIRAADLAVGRHPPIDDPVQGVLQ